MLLPRVAQLGMSFRDIRLGHGQKAKVGDVLVLTYTTSIVGEPADAHPASKRYVFVLGDHTVIAAWDKGLEGMRVGGSREIVASPEYAYGAKGLPPTIPPNATMKFVVHLLTIKPILVKTVRAGTGVRARRGDSITVEMEAATSLEDLARFGAAAWSRYTIKLGDTFVPDGVTDGLVGVRAGEVRRISVPYALAIQIPGVAKVLPKGSPMIYEVRALTVTAS